MPRFSIIVPVYNVQNYLAACVKSVAEQAGERDWECILVDDGSTDLSASFAMPLPLRSPACGSSTGRTAVWPPRATPGLAGRAGRLAAVFGQR